LGTRATKDGPEESNYLVHFLVDFPDYRPSKDTLWDHVNVIPVNATHAVRTGPDSQNDALPELTQTLTVSCKV